MFKGIGIKEGLSHLILVLENGRMYDGQIYLFKLAGLPNSNPGYAEMGRSDPAWQSDQAEKMYCWLTDERRVNSYTLIEETNFLKERS